MRANPLVEQRDFVVLLPKASCAHIAAASLRKQNPAHLVFSFTQ